MTSSKNLPDVAAQLKARMAAVRAALPRTQRLFKDYLETQAGELSTDTVRRSYFSGYDSEYLDHLVAGLVEEIENNSDPALELGFVIAELQGLIRNLQRVQKDFAAYVEAHGEAA